MSERTRRLPSLPPGLLREQAPSRLGSALYLLVLALIAFWDLSGRSIFHHDMPRFATIAREMIRSGDWLVPTQYGVTYANKPILYIWLVALGSLVPGDPTALTLRIPSALALVATAWATSLWGRARSGSVAVGRLAGLLAITTYSLHELGRVGRPDMCSTAFATIAAALVDRALLDGRGRRPWIAVGLALGGGVLSKGPVVLLIPAALVLLPRAGMPLGARLRRVRLDLALALAVALSALWIVPAGLHGGFGYVKKLVVDQVADRMMGESQHREAVWYYFASIPFSWLPWSPLFVGAGLAAATRRGRAVLGSATHVAAAAAALLVLSIVPTKEIRYAAILIPPLAVAAAQFATEWAYRPVGPGRESSDDAPSPARLHLVIAGVFAILLALAAGWPELQWPATAPWLVPLALVTILAGVGALAIGRAAVSSREVRGRIVGLAIVLAACGGCAYWVVLGRHLVVYQVAENRAVAGALDASIASVVVGGAGAETLNPDDFYEGAPTARFVSDVGGLAGLSTVRPLQLIALASDRASIEERIGATRVVLQYPRYGGSTLLILFAPR